MNIFKTHIHINQENMIFTIRQLQCERG